MSRKNVFNQLVPFKVYGFAVLIFFLSFGSSLAQTGTLVTSVEAESGVLYGGITKSTSTAGYSGTGYITNFRNWPDSLRVIVTVPTTAFYSIFVRYKSGGNKYQKIDVNGSGAADVYFPQTSGWAKADAGKYFLRAGDNKVVVKNSWGWVDIDQFLVYTTALNTYNNITSELVDPKATTATKSLYNFLLSQFGKTIISGQTDSYYTDVKTLTGQSPVYRVWDFQHYTEGYPYLWKDGGFSFGIDTGAKDTENAIAWYNSTGKKGIVGFQWHWHSPSGGNVGKNTFYTSETTFDIRKAVQKGTLEYMLIIRDIDAIAAQLIKFQTANVPVLFRPLHEAGGGWFWWGAKGSTACKQLYAILYDRLMNYHQIHNLIWVWSTYETDWYPGNGVVDIVGHDSYPGDFNYGTQKNTFDRYFQLTNGEKMVTMSENGPIPDPDACLDFDSPWSFFMSWVDLVLKQNSEAHIKAVYNNPRVLTLEKDTIPMIISTSKDPACGLGVVTLEALSNFGTVNWYAQSTGGTILNTGTSFTTPNLTEATTYYIEASYNGRPSQLKRTPIAVNSIPAAPVILSNGITIQSNVSVGNQWYYNDTMIQDAVNNTYTPTKSGNYYSIVTEKGCSSQASNVISFVVTGIDNLEENSGICIYPNPMEKDNIQITIIVNSISENDSVKIFDMNGKLVHSGLITGQTIDLGKGLNSGIYLVNVVSNGKVHTQRLIVR